MPTDLRHSPRCPICHGHGNVLDEIDPDQGPIYEPCPIAETEWLRRHSPACRDEIAKHPKEIA